MKLNLGCGTQTPAGWINVDYAMGARFARLPLFRKLNKRMKWFNLDWDATICLHDLTKPFPWADSSADIIYSSHLLEHLTKEEGRSFLAECHRVLRRNGIIRLVVPDLRHLVKEYCDGQLKADDFVERLGVLYANRSNRLKGRLAVLYQFPHQCMYDAAGLQEVLEMFGFHVATKSAFESDIRDIREVELESRTHDAVIVEGRKC